MRISLNFENTAAVERFAALTGMTPSDFVNDLIRSEFRDKLDDSDFLIDHFVGFGFGDRESAERVAQWINETSVERALNGEPGNMVSCEVLENEDGPLELEAHRMTKDGWKPYFPRLTTPEI